VYRKWTPSSLTTSGRFPASAVAWPYAPNRKSKLACSRIYSWLSRSRVAVQPNHGTVHGIKALRLSRYVDSGRKSLHAPTMWRSSIAKRPSLVWNVGSFSTFLKLQLTACSGLSRTCVKRPSRIWSQISRFYIDSVSLIISG